VKVRAADVVLDYGANVGAFTRKALSAGAKLVVAIDSSPINQEALRRTFAKEITEGRVIITEREPTLDRVDFIKMDMQGAEPKALNAIAKHHPRIALKIHHDEATKSIPGYQTICGPCVESSPWRIRPDTLLFH
jgi:hypothetical protein